MATGTITRQHGRVRFINIRGEYAQPNFKHVRMTVSTPHGDHDWTIDDGFNTNFLDLRSGDEVEIEHNTAPGKGESRYQIQNRRTNLTYTAGTVGTGCLLTLLLIPVLLMALPTRLTR